MSLVSQQVMATSTTSGQSLIEPKIETNDLTQIKQEQEFSNYAIRPIEFLSDAPQLRLKEGVTAIGRKTLSEYNVTSTDHPKKMSVSRQQARLKVTPLGVEIEGIGVNPMTVTTATETIPLERGKTCLLQVGDRFTLCAQYFPFQLEPWNVKLKPRPIIFPERILKLGNVMQAQSPSVKLEKLKSIGKRVEALWAPKTKRYVGTILSYSESLNQYEVRYDDGTILWELEHYLRGLLPQEESKKRSADSIRHAVKPKKRMTVEIIDEDDEYGGKGGSGNEKTRRSSRAASKKRVNYYYDWPSEDSDSSGSGQDLVPKSSDATRVNYRSVRDQLHYRPTAVFYSDICTKHFVPNWHLERPSRLTQIIDGIKTVAKHFTFHLKVVEENSVVPRPLLLQVHDESYINRMESQVPASDAPHHATQVTLDDERASEDCDTFMSHFSFAAAQTAAGIVCKAIDAVTTGTYRNVFCAVRPPGHHCGIKGHTATAASQGYCIINNVAVGAFHAVTKHKYKRVAVVDFDVHHGNGTEEILAGKEEFLFVSIHVGDIYPGTGGDDVDHASNIINVSLDPHSGPVEFRSAFEDKILPALTKFNPDLLLLSSGFDAHKKDPTDDGLELDIEDFAYVTEKMIDIAETHCGGKLVSVLEGGYHLPSLRKSVKEHVLGLMKRSKLADPQPPVGAITTTTTTTTISQVTTTTTTATKVAAFVEADKGVVQTAPQVTVGAISGAQPTSRKMNIIEALRNSDKNLFALTSSPSNNNSSSPALITTTSPVASSPVIAPPGHVTAS